MINIPPYQEDAFEFYTTLVQACKARKGRHHFRDEMIALHPEQEEVFAAYNRSFDENTLHRLTPYDYTPQQRTDLKSLYSYRKQQIEKLRILLTKHPVDPRRLLNTCQNCTINEVDTMDHLVPKEEFAEFAVHPKNLFPCCTTCNRMKNNIWRTGNDRRTFLNLFLDPLPDEQYLFVDFDESWTPIFSIENRTNINPNLFDLIHSHYSGFDLLIRFRRNSHRVLSRLAADIRVQTAHHSVDVVQLVIQQRCSDQKSIIGPNHWEVVLEETLANEDEFIQACIDGTI